MLMGWLRLLFRSLLSLLGFNPSLKVLDIVRMVELAELIGSGLSALYDQQFFLQVKTFDQTVSDFDSSGLHKVVFAELVVAYLFVIDIPYSSIHLLFIEFLAVFIE